jgi:predicted CopG family antitoxin
VLTVKTLNIALDETEYKALIKVKGNRSWRELLLSTLPDKKLEAIK